MRKCHRCGEGMKEDYGLKIRSLMFAGIAPVFLSKGQGVLSDELGKVKAAVCPNCGEISLYTENSKVLNEKL